MSKQSSARLRKLPIAVSHQEVRYGNGWMPQVTEYAKTPLLDLIPRFRQMAAEIGRDPASLEPR